MTPRFNAQGPIRPSGLRRDGQIPKGSVSALGLPTSSRPLDEFDEHPPRLYAHRGWVASRDLSRSGSLPVPAEAVAKHRLGETSDAEPKPFAATWGLHWSIQAKVLALLVWLGAAIGAVLGAVRQGLQLDSLVSEREHLGRSGAMERLIRVALTPASTGLSADYHFQVFLPNSDRTRLMPEFDPERAGPIEGWRIDEEPAQAVTGAAWSTNSYVFAKGGSVSDATYGLTPEQQAGYRNLTGVAATPIQNARGHAVAVLTVFTSRPQPVVSDPDVVVRIVALAEFIARILIDVGGKASDRG